MASRLIFFICLIFLTVFALKDIHSSGIRQLFAPFETITTVPFNGDLDELDERWFETWDTPPPSLDEE